MTFYILDICILCMYKVIFLNVLFMFHAKLINLLTNAIYIRKKVILASYICKNCEILKEYLI